MATLTGNSWFFWPAFLPLVDFYFGKITQVIDLIGAPGTIRTCDRLVRSLPHILSKSITWPVFFWPKPSPLAPFINNLAPLFGRNLAAKKWLKGADS